jgi:mRNA-degrading endonuclease RelE of RelBE toxin-antitoxin system
MVREITRSPNFIKQIEKLDNSYVLHIQKLIQKIIENPEIGKPMRFGRKGTREVYVSQFRLSYFYDKTKDALFLLDLYHKDKQ